MIVNTCTFVLMSIAKDGNSSLHIAASNGFLDVVNIFLSDQRCDVNTVESVSSMLSRCTIPLILMKCI